MQRILTHSYYFIHYEDLASDPIYHLRRLYDFMGVPFGPAEEEKMRLHTEADSDNDKAGKRFSTYRFGWANAEGQTRPHLYRHQLRTLAGPRTLIQTAGRTC